MSILTQNSKKYSAEATSLNPSATTEKKLISEKTPRLSGNLSAPRSKSYTHRAIIVASMNGRTTIKTPLFCDDTRNTIKIWNKLGAEIKESEDGSDLHISGFEGVPVPQSNTLNVGESGTLLRFVLPMLGLAKAGNYEITGKGSLFARRNAEVVRALQSWGMDLKGQGDNDTIPIDLTSNGHIRGGTISIPSNLSSQTVSAVLMAAPFADGPTVIEIDGDLVSKPYVDVTMDVLKWAGIIVGRPNEDYSCFTVDPVHNNFNPPTEYKVNGDYSSCAFIMAAAVLLDSKVVIEDIKPDFQGDYKIIKYLREMGAQIDVDAEQSTITICGPQELNGIEIDCCDTPDLAPILTTLGCFAKGHTRLYNVKHLKHKESNRLKHPAEELNSLGGHVAYDEEKGEIISYYSADSLQGGEVSARNDHRIAMSMAVAGMKTDQPVVINGAHSIEKSYPDFVNDMTKLGARLSLE
jgi:3-phosphoshikimate 1-carboxyvinyltransferase